MLNSINEESSGTKFDKFDNEIAGYEQTIKEKNELIKKDIEVLSNKRRVEILTRKINNLLELKKHFEKAIKEKFWTNHQKQYISMQRENVEILKYTKDFIPDDDTIYNLVFETEIFKKIKKETEKYRQKLLQEWDKNKKLINKNLNEILRFKDELSYSVIVVNPSIDVVEYIKSNPKKNIAWGRKEESNNIQKQKVQKINI